MEGTVAFYDRLRGFGFIIPDVNKDDQDDFVHHSQLKNCRRLEKGERVRYELGAISKKTGRAMATAVEPLIPRTPPQVGLTLEQSVQKELAAIIGGAR